MKKKTHEEYVVELKEKNPNVEVCEEYIDAKTKIKHHCLIHDVYWDIAPYGALQGNGCEFCRRSKVANFHQKSHVEYIKELHDKNPNIITLEEYIDAKTPILHKCLTHNVEWKISPSCALSGRGCKRCKSDKIKNKLSKTNVKYIEELSVVNKNIIPIEEYDGANTKILHRCLIDGYEWYATPANMLNGCGCPRCSKRFRRNHKDYVYEVSVVNPDIDVVGEFIGLQIPILHKCKIHNKEWMATPANILNGHGCSECGNEKIGEQNRKTHEQYISDLKNKNKDIITVDTYINANTPILHKCLIDGYEWYARPSNILSGYGCPQCNESKGEREVRQWLEKHDIKYIYQNPFEDCIDIKPLLFDFYLPKLNMCIEYDGEQHFRPIGYFGGEEKFKLQQKHDRIKNEYCNNNNIKLLRIPYFKNVEEELNNFLFI